MALFSSPDYFKIFTLSGNAAIVVMQFVASCCQNKISGGVTSHDLTEARK